jgi:hypothetical protein
MEPSRWDPSCEKSNHGHKINTTSCCGNTMTGGNPWIDQENFKTKILTPTSNLTWLQLAVRNFESGTVASVIWLRSEYQICKKLPIFPTVICTPRYDKRFRSYAILKSAGQLEFCSEQIWVVWEIWTFDPNTNRISGNFQYQTHS